MRTFLLEKHFNISMFVIGVLVGGVLLFTNHAWGISVTTPELPIQTGEVTSDKILDGTIVNADVSSSAAIAVSKIATTTSNYFVTSEAQTKQGVQTFNQFPQLPAGTPTSTGAVSAAYLATQLGNITGTSTAGEGINTGDPIFIANQSHIRDNVLTKTGADNANDCTFMNVGQSGTNGSGCAQSFSTSSVVQILGIRATQNKVGTPTGTMIFTLRPDNGGTPSSTVLASTTASSAGLTGSKVTYTYLWNVPFTSVASTTYWIVASSTDTASDTNYVLIGASNTATNPPGAKILQNSAWGTLASSNGLSIDVVTGITAGQAGRASANTTSTSYAFVGFAQATTSALSTVTINEYGTQNMTGLSPGMRYYLANATGTISTATGTITQGVGTALNATTLRIANNW